MAKKEPNFFKPQNKLCLVMTEASVSVAKSPCSLLHYPFLETERERLKIITFKKGINTHTKKLNKCHFHSHLCIDRMGIASSIRPGINK